MNRLIPHSRSAPQRRALVRVGVGVPLRQRGLALITAVLIVAIIAALATSMSLGQQIWLRQAQNFNDRAQAEKVAQGGLQFSLQVLQDDANKSAATDDLSEKWAQPQTFSAAGGMISGQISDAQGLFNLNNLLLADGINPSKPDMDVFRQLLVSLSLDPEPLIANLRAWMDINSNQAPVGAEDTYYLTLQPPYRTANHLLASVDELRLVRGYDAKTVERLRRYVTALPERTSLNINTAAPELLSALFTALPLSTAQQLVSERDKNRNPFKSKDELAQRAGQPLPAGANVDVKSAYFYVDIMTKFGHISRTRRTLVHRVTGGKTVEILWQENLMGLPTTAGTTAQR